MRCNAIPVDRFINPLGFEAEMESQAHDKAVTAQRRIEQAMLQGVPRNGEAVACRRLSATVIRCASYPVLSGEPHSLQGPSLERTEGRLYDCPEDMR